MSFCKRNGWHFRLRLKCDTWIRANRRWFQLRDLNLAAGEKRYFQSVYITRARRGPYQLAVYRGCGKDDPWYIATDQTAQAKTLVDYKKRFYVEPMFSDFKKRGFNLEETRIQFPDRIDRLMLIVVISYLFVTGQGLRCIRYGQRRFFEKTKTRFYSLARLGELYFSHQFERGKSIKLGLPRLC